MTTLMMGDPYPAGNSSSTPSVLNSRTTQAFTTKHPPNPGSSTDPPEQTAKTEKLQCCIGIQTLQTGQYEPALNTNQQKKGKAARFVSDRNTTRTTTTTQDKPQHCGNKVTKCQHTFDVHKQVTRFKNPYLKHQLSAIALNSISKWKTRCLPSLIAYLERNAVVLFILETLVIC